MQIARLPAGTGALGSAGKGNPMRLFVAAILLAFSAVPAVAAETIKTADLATVSRRGAQLYAFDQAAWHTTDTMLAKGLPREAMQAIRGWVVEPRGDLLTVTYYGWNGTVPYAIYIADFHGGKVVAERVPATDGERTLSASGARMAAAADVARAVPLSRCTDRSINTVILPPEPNGTIPVYLLTPMVKEGAYPFGGHHEVDIGTDGKVVATRDFTKSCLVMEPPAKAVMAFVTHLLDPHPTELHVYLSLWMGKPLAVGTDKDKVWEVDGTHIASMDLKKDGARK